MSATAKKLVSLLAVILLASSASFSQISFELPIGKTKFGFTFTKSGTLRFRGKEFSPPVKTAQTALDRVERFKISFLQSKKLAGAIAVDGDGMDSFFLLNTAMRSSKKFEDAVAAKEMFWSPSGKYLVIHCAYEGERFVSIDLRTKKLVSDDGIFSEDKIWYLKNTPKWLNKSDIFSFQAEVMCNPYGDEQNCNYRDSIYEITLNAATLKVIKKKFLRLSRN